MAKMMVMVVMVVVTVDMMVGVRAVVLESSLKRINATPFPGLFPDC